VKFSFHEYSVGAGEYLRHGDPLPAAALKACGEADAVLLGAMGLPNVRWPDGKEMTPQLDLREKFQLYCGLRPIRLYYERDTPLKRYGGSGGFPAVESTNNSQGRLENRPSETIDFVIIRESTEGSILCAPCRKPDLTQGEVRDVMRITRTGSERVCRAAFRAALKRRRRSRSWTRRMSFLPWFISARSSMKWRRSFPM
jgi:3-isopropylmalate dehydrogenase